MEQEEDDAGTLWRDLSEKQEPYPMIWGIL